VLKVLIAEDDVLIADMVKDLLVEAGYRVCGIARTVDEAITLNILHKPDLAVVDQRLAGGGLGTDLAMKWADSDVIHRPGVLYATGNAAHVMAIASAGDACLVKPYNAEDLIRSLQLVVEIVATGTVSPPFPRGFRRMELPWPQRTGTAHG
jgi:DNA-binding response OmpR family regulator